MAAELSMNGKKKIETLQKEFTQKFAYLTLVFLDKERRAIDISKSLSEVRQAKGDDISIIASLKINTLEKRFLENFGLIVEVAYQKSDKVVYTKDNVDKTLNELNKWCEENDCQPFEFKKSFTGNTLSSVQEQLFEAIKAYYPNAEAKKINKDNYLDIYVPEINKKRGTHLYFNTAKDGIKIGFYCRDEEFVEAVLSRSTNIEQYAQGIRILDNPLQNDLEEATASALSFLEEISGQQKSNPQMDMEDELDIESVIRELEAQIAAEEGDLDQISKDLVYEGDEKGNQLLTVEIGNQKWTTMNLDVDTFANGDPIPYAESDEDWIIAGNNKNPAWCFLNNDVSNGEMYGKLYNWYAVNDPRGLAPAGYHIPTEAEWDTLDAYLGFSGGIKMRKKNGWKDGKSGIYTWVVNCQNTSGFSGLPGGVRLGDGRFWKIDNKGVWWSRTESNPSSAFNYCLYNDNDLLNKCNDEKFFGFSVRCIKEKKNNIDDDIADNEEQENDEFSLSSFDVKEKSVIDKISDEIKRGKYLTNLLYINIKLDELGYAIDKHQAYFFDSNVLVSDRELEGFLVVNMDGFYSNCMDEEEMNPIFSWSGVNDIEYSETKNGCSIDIISDEGALTIKKVGSHSLKILYTFYENVWKEINESFKDEPFIEWGEVRDMGINEVGFSTFLDYYNFKVSDDTGNSE